MATVVLLNLRPVSKLRVCASRVLLKVPVIEWLFPGAWLKCPVFLILI